MVIREIQLSAKLNIHNVVIRRFRLVTNTTQVHGDDVMAWKRFPPLLTSVSAIHVHRLILLTSGQ